MPKSERVTNYSLFLLLAGAWQGPAAAQLGDWVAAHQRISDTRGQFGGSLEDGDTFGISVEGLGDLDGDGLLEVAVGTQFDDGNGVDRGAVWILTLNPIGTVARETKIADQTGGFSGTLRDGDLFGHELASIGDLDGDGVLDLVVSSIWDDDGGTDVGALWVLFMNTDGTVKAQQKISATSGNLSAALEPFDAFGIDVAGPGDLDGDGLVDLLVGSWADDDGGLDRGAFFVLYLNVDGTVKSHRKVSQTSGGFPGVLADGDFFGGGLAVLPDLDGDGVPELGVGSHGSDEVGNMSGSIWILFMNADESVSGAQKISPVHGNFGGQLSASDLFGINLATLSDFDGDGRPELGVSAVLDDSGGRDRGALWVLFLGDDGTVRTEIKLAAGLGGFNGRLRNDDHFGRPAAIGDVNGDGVPDLVVGATGTDDGGPMRGAIWVLMLNRCESSSLSTRNGSGQNPELLSAGDSPRLGLVWAARLDASGHPPGCAVLIGTGASASGPVFPVGELLIDTSAPRVARLLLPHVGAPVTFQIAVPSDLSLCGAQASFQGLVTGGTIGALSNALDVVLGP